MPKHRVLVLGADSVFREGMLLLLERVEDVSLVGAWELDGAAPSRVAAVAPDIVLIVDAGEASVAGATVTHELLEHYAEMVVIRVNSQDGVLRIHAGSRRPADLITLLRVIRGAPPGGASASEQP
ncbi:MAG: hypothetical protein U0641_00635 [Anaerolineae bacterium]